MNNTLLDEIYDMSIADKLKIDSGIFEKIVEKYKKSSSFDDETEIANDLSELICIVQKTAFKAGVKAAVDVWNELIEDEK